MSVLLETTTQKALSSAVAVNTVRLRDTDRRFSCERMVTTQTDQTLKEGFTDPVSGETFVKASSDGTIGRAVAVGSATILRGYPTPAATVANRRGVAIPNLPWRGKSIVNFMMVVRASSAAVTNGFTGLQYQFGEWAASDYSGASFFHLGIGPSNVVLSATHGSTAETAVTVSVPRSNDWMGLRGQIDYAGNQIMLTDITRGIVARASGDPAVWTGVAASPAAGFAKFLGGPAANPWYCEAADFCFWGGARTAAQDAVIDDMMRARIAILSTP